MTPRPPVHLLQITSGRGPAEVRRFVRLLALHIASELGVTAILAGDPLAPGSATMSVDPSEAARWVGTHQLLAALRGRRSRRRWFVQVALFESPPSVGRSEIVVTTARAGGPGGQNVNKRATAVRAVDRVTGLAVRATAARSQSQNKALALQRLHDALERRERAVQEEQVADRRAAHGRVVRGGATFTWELGGDGIVARGEHAS